MLIYNCERTNKILTIVRGYSLLTIVYKHMLILLFIMNLKMTVGRSKRRLFLNNINILYFLYDGPRLLGKHCFEALTACSISLLRHLRVKRTTIINISMEAGLSCILGAYYGASPCGAVRTRLHSW